METPEHETPGINSRNSKLPTGMEKWNLGRFLFSALIVALSSDVFGGLFHPPPPQHTLPLSVCMHLRCVLVVVTRITDSVLSVCVCARVCVPVFGCMYVCY